MAKKKAPPKRLQEGQKNNIGEIHVKGGIEGGRDVILGNQNIYISQVLQISGFRPPRDLDEVKESYLRFVRQSYRALDF